MHFTASGPMRSGRPFAPRLSSPKPTLVEAMVDADEKPTKPDELKV
jgi:hypothetical protein